MNNITLPFYKISEAITGRIEYAVPDDELVALRSNVYINDIYYKIIQTFESEYNEDKLMSAFNHLRFVIYSFGKHSVNDIMIIQVLEELQGLPYKTWIDIMSISKVLKMETIKIFKHLPVSSVNEIIQKSSYMIEDKVKICDMIVELYLDKKWYMRESIIKILACSTVMYKWFYKFNGTSSKSIISLGFKHDKITTTQILKWNASAIAYLSNKDDTYDKTIRTINGYDLWETILCNPGVGHLLNYAIDNFWTVKHGVPFEF